MATYQEGTTHVDGWCGTQYRKVSDTPLSFEYFSQTYNAWRPATMVYLKRLVPVGDLS